LEEHNVFNFGVKQSKKKGKNLLGLLDPQDQGTAFFWSVSNYDPVDKA
jgi:hypothetical protein